jgi:hypothetical protein
MSKLGLAVFVTGGRLLFDCCSTPKIKRRFKKHLRLLKPPFIKALILLFTIQGVTPIL